MKSKSCFPTIRQNDRWSTHTHSPRQSHGYRKRKNSHWEHWVDKQSQPQRRCRIVSVIESKVYWRNLCLQFSELQSDLCDDLHDRLQQHLPLVARPGQARSSLVRVRVRIRLDSVRFGLFRVHGISKAVASLGWLFFSMPSSLSFVFGLFFSSQGESLSPSSILLLLFVQHLVLCVLCILFLTYFFLSRCFDFCCFAWPWIVTLHALLVISCTNISYAIRNLPAYES